MEDKLLIQRAQSRDYNPQAKQKYEINYILGKFNV